MTVFPDQEHSNQAWKATRQALGLTQDATLRDGEISVFLKHLLIQGLKGRETGEGGKASPKALRDCLESRLGALQLALRMDCDFVRDVCFDRVQARRSLNFSRFYRQRLVDLALATMLSESLAPDICLETEPWSVNDLAAALPCNRHHAVIFADAVLFHHEFYPLAVDAYVHDSQLGATRTNVLGTHVDWLSPDGSPKRILFLDADTGCLREADLASPIRPDSAQFHSMGKNEQNFHRQWSDALPCLQVNPYGVSSLADDKAATLAGWAAMGIEVPAFAKLVDGDFQSAWHFVKAYREVVAKPNQSTEGDGVAYFEVGQDHFAAAFAKHLESCWRQGDAIVQERRDGLVFRDSHYGTRHNLVLRLNLAFDGNAYHVESGYAQLGGSFGQPAARSQGGRIVSPLEILDGLCSRTDSARPRSSLVRPDWLRICDQSVRAASLFRGLLLVGLDVLLDLDADGNIRPVFLEANPRPAGLCHSRLLNGYPDSCLAPNGVSLKLWDGLEQI